MGPEQFSQFQIDNIRTIMVEKLINPEKVYLTQERLDLFQALADEHGIELKVCGIGVNIKTEGGEELVGEDRTRVDILASTDDRRDFWKIVRESGF